jgi:hypothetical protein
MPRQLTLLVVENEVVRPSKKVGARGGGAACEPAQHQRIANCHAYVIHLAGSAAAL